ncbi:hypothetical protein PI87_16510 [Ralstonia sp. A12]|uniref:hypothetical protein n=1 Tax=Ralstonia sp. A12 TaxID=1217052 RepID=UPI0005738F8F|nr:hypothetical protein [Ralstonia sp. A12]KHK54116.1 hypothetical protein PI87_16510 [Ralstonia sp. A12]
MQIAFGKHDGKSSEEVFLRHGSYVKWVLGQANAGSSLSLLRKDFENLITKFDAKPTLKPCHHCTEEATLVTAYWNSDSSLYAWCNDCDPYSAGADKGKLYVLHKVQDAFKHVELRCGGKQGGYDRIVRALARSKGLPVRVSAAAAKQFFA